MRKLGTSSWTAFWALTKPSSVTLTFPYQEFSGETVEPETLQEYLATTPGQFPGFPLVLGSTDSDQERSNP